MRTELLYNPFLLIERIAEFSEKRRRLSKLKCTVASSLKFGHITSLEFIEIANKNSQGAICTIFDLGGNEGKWSLLAKALIPSATVHGFEPIPMYQEEYLKNTKHIDGIVLHKVGAGSENKKEKFNFAKHSSSFLEITETLTNMFPSQAKSAEYTVDMVSIDDYAENNKIHLPDLMKLDVEGFEIEVLKGGIKCMKNCRYIILEVSFIERHLKQPLFHDIIKFMAEHDFYIYSFPQKMHLAQKIYVTDILFENKKYASKEVPVLEI